MIRWLGQPIIPIPFPVQVLPIGWPAGVPMPAQPDWWPSGLQYPAIGNSWAPTPPPWWTAASASLPNWPPPPPAGWPANFPWPIPPAAAAPMMTCEQICDAQFAEGGTFPNQQFLIACKQACATKPTFPLSPSGFAPGATTPAEPGTPLRPAPIASTEEKKSNTALLVVGGLLIVGIGALVIFGAD